MGDIVYSIPSILKLLKKFKETEACLFIPSDKKANSHPGVKHIGEGLMFSQGMFDYIQPLLGCQGFIQDVVYGPESDIPADAIDFDIIRSGAVNISACNIIDYYFKAFALVKDQPKAWIQLPLMPSVEHFDVLVGRSSRYVNKELDYQVLADYEIKCGFVGTRQEHELFCHDFPELAISYVPTVNALETAHYIANSTVYLGNQSFFFSLAESLQHPRVLEVFEPVPNVIPSGGICAQALSTKGLILILNELLSQAVSFNAYVNRPTAFVLTNEI